MLQLFTLMNGKHVLYSLFACWFQPAQTSQPIVFSSHNKPAPASLNQPRNQPPNRLIISSLFMYSGCHCLTDNSQFLWRSQINSFLELRDHYIATKALFRSHSKSKIIQDFPSHRILRHIHGALNVGKKITNCTVCS